MQRVTISLDEGLAQAFDDLTREAGYRSRSEAVRDLVRKAVDDRRLETTGSADCVANLSYVYDHRTRGLAARLAELTNANHDLVVSTLQVPLDHEASFASMILHGPSSAVRALAEGLGAERGVRFAKLNLVSVHPNDRHRGGHHHEHDGHEHLSPHPG